MTWKTLFVFCLLAAAIRSVKCCCGGYKILQLRRPEFLSMYEPQQPCEPIFDGQDSFYDNGYMPVYHEPVSKFEDSLDRYLANYFEPKPIPTKSYCSKQHPPPPRMMPNTSKYYKRGFGNEPLMEAIPMRTSMPCGQFGCGHHHHHEGCRPFGTCEMTPNVFRHSPQRVLRSLSLPPSCIC